MSPREVPTRTKKVRRALTDEMIAKSFLEVLGGKSRAQSTVMAHLATECSMFETTFDGDVNEMLFREGQRSVFIRIAELSGLSLADIKENMETVGDWA